MFGVAIGLATAAGVVTAGGALVACGGQEGAKFANVKPGEMPADQTWVGVYYNPVYGYLHVVDNGGNIVGRWKRTDASSWGELSGTAEGNVLHYSWTEHKYGAIGPSSDLHGSGVFVYKMGNDKFGELDGQYAIDGQSDIGNWHCVKQNNIKPDLNSINGDNPAETPPTQDKWN